MMRSLLTKQFGFNPKYVIELYDEGAMRENILRAFEVLAKQTSVDDRVLYFMLVMV